MTKWMIVAVFLCGLAVAVLAAPSAKNSQPCGAKGGACAMDKFVKPNREELKKRLSKEQFDVTQDSGTEPPFHNAFWNNKESGLYVDVLSGEVLFSSLDKFDSGTGWPSFSRPLEAGHIVEKSDVGFGMARTEVRSKHGDSHLGHVFPDGPKPTGVRYCINSAALRFVPASRLVEEGYGQYAALFSKAATPQAVATLAGGCFWGMEEILRDIPGVISTEVGYIGGKTENPVYENVKTGRSGHAEAVQVTFDPRRISYEEILGYFFRMHDPTTLNQQGNDVGTQYRSAIFFQDENQRKTALQVKARVSESGKWKQPIVTEIVPAGPFYPAEEYHQDYLQKHPGGYSCHYLRD